MTHDQHVPICWCNLSGMKYLGLSLDYSTAHMSEYFIDERLINFSA